MPALCPYSCGWAAAKLEAPSPSGRELAHSFLSAAATGPGTGLGAGQALPGVGVDMNGYEAALSPGSLPRPEVGAWGALQQVGEEAARALAPSSSHLGPEAGSAAQSPVETVHGGSLWRRVTQPQE